MSKVLRCFPAQGQGGGVPSGDGQNVVTDRSAAHHPQAGLVLRGQVKAVLLRMGRAQPLPGSGDAAVFYRPAPHRPGQQTPARDQHTGTGVLNRAGLADHIQQLNIFRGEKQLLHPDIQLEIHAQVAVPRSLA